MIILVVTAVVVAVFLAVAATRPAAYQVERTLEVAAPTERVFGVLDDLDQLSRVVVLFGSPLEAGKATLTIEDRVPGQRVGAKLDIVAPMKSTAIYALSLAGTPTGALVTWSMRGTHNFLGKAAGMIVNMDKAIGADLEKGLARLKTAVEANE